MQATSPVSELDDDARFPARRRCTLLPAGDDSAGRAQVGNRFVTRSRTAEKRGTRRPVRLTPQPWHRARGPGTVTSRMPELPELEALVRAMDEPVSASPVARPPEAHFAVLKTADPPLASLAGQQPGGRRCDGGSTCCSRSTDGTTLAVHLMSGGRIGYAAPERAQARQRGADGAVRGRRGARGDGGRAAQERPRPPAPRGRPGAICSTGLGPEPLEPEFDRAALDAMLDARPRQLNSLLRDQRAVAGIGRAFADEILHAARLSPFAISDAARRRTRASACYDAIRAVLGAAVLACATAGHAAAGQERRAAAAGARPRRRPVPALRDDACASSTSSRTASCTARPARRRAASWPTAGSPSSCAERG